MMGSMVRDQLGGGHQETLQQRGAFGVVCCSLGSVWVAGVRCLEGGKYFRQREENMQRPRGIKVHGVSSDMSTKPHRQSAVQGR